MANSELSLWRAGGCRKVLTESVSTEYLMSGSPDIPADLLLSDAATLSSMEPFFEVELTADELKPRFFTSEGNLNHAILLEEEFRAVLVQLFAYWVYRGYHARDFIQATKHCAITVYHQYTTVKAMGGLGGCKTMAQFFSTRLKS